MNDNSSSKNITPPIYLNAKQWQKHCYAWQKTSVSKAEYCRTHGLEVTQFYYWCQQVLSCSVKNSSPDFIPVVTTRDGSVQERLWVELYFSSQMHCRIELPSGQLLSFIQELKELSDAAAIIR